MNNLLTFIGNPAIFSYVILALYILNALRWAFERNLGQSLCIGCVRLGSPIA